MIVCLIKFFYLKLFVIKSFCICMVLKYRWVSSNPGSRQLKDWKLKVPEACTRWLFPLMFYQGPLAKDISRKRGYVKMKNIHKFLSVIEFTSSNSSEFFNSHDTYIRW